MIDARGVTNYTYDARDRLTRIVQPGGATLSYAYDASSNRIALVTPTDSNTYSYDPVGQLIGVRSNGASVATMNYDPVGLRTLLTRGNGIATTYVYNSLDRLTNITHKRGVTPLASYSYTLDPAGNRTALTEGDSSSTSWTYDAAYRLLSETRVGVGGTATPAPSATSPIAPTFVPNTPAGTLIPSLTPSFTPFSSPTPSGGSGSGSTSWSLSWTYDAVGNRLSQTADGVTTPYAYNINDQLTAAGTALYSYDLRGNLTRIVNGVNTTSYTWDGADRLTGVVLPNGIITSNTYDPDGHRVRMVENGVITNYLWDEASPYGDVVLESDVSDNAQMSYVLAGSELLRQNHLVAYSLRC